MEHARLVLCALAGIMTAMPYVLVQHDRSKISYAMILFILGTLVAEKITRRVR